MILNTVSLIQYSALCRRYFATLIQPFYRACQAVGGPWPKPVDKTTILPTYHKIDYVRIAQPI